MRAPGAPPCLAQAAAPKQQRSISLHHSTLPALAARHDAHEQGELDVPWSGSGIVVDACRRRLFLDIFSFSFLRFCCRIAQARQA